MNLAPPAPALERIDMADLAPYPTDRRILAARAEPPWVALEWDDGRRSRFHALWLRDNCPCPACRHPQALERQFLLIEALDAIRLEAAALTPGGNLEVRFAGGHASRFAAGWLRHHCGSAAARAERARPPRLWSADPAKQPPAFAYEAIMAADGALGDWLTALCREGATLVRGGPARPGELQRIAARVGPLRPTNFGVFYDVISQPNPNASADTPIGLEPHTDLANWRWPPDFQLLFCVANEATGGGSILVDGFAAAAALRAEAPEDFDLLARTPIDFRFHDASCDIRHRAPTIALDAEGAVVAIRFNNWLRAAPDLAEDAIEPTYRALCRFWGLLRQPRFQMRLKLEAGEMLAFDNARVLHGREPFDPNTGRRHLQGGYLDRDLVSSRLRLLARQRAG